MIKILAADMIPIKSLYYESGSKRLENRRKIQRFCMTSLLSSSGRNSAYFDNIPLKLSKRGYSEVCFRPCCQNMKILKDIFTTSLLINSFL